MLLFLQFPSIALMASSRLVMFSVHASVPYLYQNHVYRCSQGSRWSDTFQSHRARLNVVIGLYMLQIKFDFRLNFIFLCPD